MILWHLATALLVFRWVFRDPGADLRWLFLGAVAPDLVDMPIGTLIWADSFSSGEIFGHSLLAPAVLGGVVLVATGRAGRARRNLMVMTVGWLIHLVVDGIWLHPEVFWWPLRGAQFPAQELPFWPGAWERALADPWRWVFEIIGLAYLAILLSRSDLGMGQAARRLARTGRLA